MDLGIQGRRAIVCASSAGLGLACATALAAEGVTTVINGRSKDRLDEGLEVAQATATAEVVAVRADITTAEGRASLLDACPDPDILVTNNAGPRPGTFFEVSDEDLEHALLLHYWTPISLVKSVLPGMRERRWGRIVNITSAMVASPGPRMAPSAGARTGLTAVMKGIAREVAADNVTINQLLPERIDSGRQVQVARVDMERLGITFEEARRRQAASIPVGRLGRPSELGAACAFLCSEPAGYISGTNLRLDGGSYVGLI